MIDGEFGPNIIQLVDKAIQKAQNSTEYQSTVSLRHGYYQYFIKDERSTLKDDSQRIVYVHGIDINKDIYDYYLNHCRKHNKNFDYRVLIKGSLTFVFLSQIFNTKRPYIGFQYQNEGIIEAPETVGLTRGHFKSKLITAECYTRPKEKSFLLFNLRSNEHIPKHLQEILDAEGVVFNVYITETNEKYYFGLSHILPFCFNYM